jgi:DNA uptake protein ComE-like DNA-binding protein
MRRRIPRDRNSRKPFSEHLKDLFSLHRGERRGFLAITVLLLIAAGWAVYHQWFQEPKIPDLSEAEKELQEWVEAGNVAAPIDTVIALRPIVPFDPNDLDQQGWMKFGLTQRQAASIMRYVEKGGRFRTKKDVQKMYAITPDLFGRLEPNILLPDSFITQSYEPRTFQKEEYPAKQEKSFEKWSEASSPITPVEVNSADTTQLVTLPGIGPAFARGIVKYRNILGGYVSLDQLSEVFVLRDKPDAVEKLKQLLVVDPSQVKRIDINTATAEELKAHPYLNWKIANGLVNFRKQHGPFRSVEDVKRSVLMNDTLFLKIAPYLKVE